MNYYLLWAKVSNLKSQALNFNKQALFNDLGIWILKCCA
jgi:hypothetical protein